MTDEELLHAWRGGDPDAGGQLVERHFDAVSRFFRNKAPDHADDLVQRTFLTCVEPGTAFRGEGSFRAFLFGIARNMLLEMFRGRSRDARVAPDFNVSSIVDLSPGVATVAARRADQQLLHRALQRVPLELQILLELYYWENASIDELAQITNLPAGTVKSRLHRARGLLREVIQLLPASDAERRTAEQILDAREG